MMEELLKGHQKSLASEVGRLFDDRSTSSVSFGHGHWRIEAQERRASMEQDEKEAWSVHAVGEQGRQRCRTQGGSGSLGLVKVIEHIVDLREQAGMTSSMKLSDIRVCVYDDARWRQVSRRRSVSRRRPWGRGRRALSVYGR